MSMDKIDNAALVLVEVKAFAFQNHMTCQQIADKAGMKRSNISAILSGKRNPTLTTFNKIVEAVGCRIEIVSNI